MPAQTSPSSADPDTKLVGALVSGLRIIRYLGRQREPVGVTRIARDLNLNPSTCFNLLRTLVHERLTTFDVATKTYTPAIGLMELIRGSLEPSSHIRSIHPELERLAAVHQVTASLWQRSGSNRVVLTDYAESRATIRLHLSIGQRLPWNIAALGRCFMAHANLPVARLKAEFDKLRWQDRPDFETYLGQIREARHDGYAIDRENYVKGVTTVSSVVTDAFGQASMAISAVAFSAQLDEAKLHRLATDIRDVSARVSSALSIDGESRGTSAHEPESARS